MDELRNLGKKEEDEIKYEVANSSNYQLDNLDYDARQELIEESRRQANEKLDTFSQKLFEKVASFKAEATVEVKTILALNSLFSRELDQHAAFSLEGFEHVTNRFNDMTLLYNNNFIEPEGNNLRTEYSVYVLVEPEIYEEDKVTLGLTNFERISQATEIYEMDNIDYKLYLYINTDNYDLYNSLEDDLKNVLGEGNYTVVSSLPNIDIRAQADVTVDYWTNSSVAEIVNSFTLSFNLFAHRRKKVYFAVPTADSRTKAFGTFDFLLLAKSNLQNLVIANNVVQPLAKHATKLWLGDNSNFKFKYEEIEDFFNSPNLVLVQGLSPLYGIIVAKKMRIKGAVIDVDSGEETLIDFDIDNEGDISGIYHEEELNIYLKMNTKNLRSDLIKWKKQIIRISSIEKSITILGKTRSNKKSSRYELKGDLSTVTLLSDFYKEGSYNNLLKLPKAKPFYLPERFKIYLLRLAHAQGFLVPEVDTRWFSRNNNVLPEVLEMLDEKFDLDNILGYSITSTDGILTKELLVSLEGLKCLTREN